MAVYLHIQADFDEKEIRSKVYASLDDFVSYKSEQFENTKDLVEYINGFVDSEEEPEYVEKHLYNLMDEGYSVGEWDFEEFYEVKGSIKLGVVL